MSSSTSERLAGPAPRVSAAALALYQARPPAIGMPADLILYDWPEDSGALGQVGLTLMGGAIAWQG